MTNNSKTENEIKKTEIIHWASSYLLSHNYKLISNAPETVQHTPWSYVTRFKTSDGCIYLKHTPKLIAEVSIIQLLREKFNAPVPIVIANNTELSCFIMKDAGAPLRQLLK